MIAFLCIYFLISHIQMVYPSFDECGISYNEVADRLIHQVVGGHRSSLGSWPWVVAIHANGKKICTGSIISRNYVLTAAHCTIDQGSNDEIVEFSIHAGSIFAVGGGGMIIDVELVKRYDDFYNKDLVPNDIALLQVIFSL